MGIEPGSEGCGLTAQSAPRLADGGTAAGPSGAQAGERWQHLAPLQEL
jgi:hypothetical protein